MNPSSCPSLLVSLSTKTLKRFHEEKLSLADPLLIKGMLSVLAFTPFLSPSGMDSLCPPTASCCFSLWPDICLPSPHGSPTQFYFGASHTPTLALSSVTQPNTHAILLPPLWSSCWPLLSAGSPFFTLHPPAVPIPSPTHL